MTLIIEETDFGLDAEMSVTRVLCCITSRHRTCGFRFIESEVLNLSYTSLVVALLLPREIARDQTCIDKLIALNESPFMVVTSVKVDVIFRGIYRSQILDLAVYVHAPW